MKRVIVLLAVGLFSCVIVLAQKTVLLVNNDEKSGMHLIHKVAPKESYYAVGRLYNVEPKLLASYNNLNLAKGLQIDQIIKIPLKEINFIQSGNAGTPVYYQTATETSLLQVSSVNNNVAVANLQQWNGKAGYQVNTGEKLVIGFLQSKEMPSVIIENKTTAVASPVNSETNVLVESSKPVEREEEKAAEVVEAMETKKESAKEKKPVRVLTEETNNTGAGFFKAQFLRQVKAESANNDRTVTSGIFKTISGWADGKYYLLMDNLFPGTIIQITNPSSGKIVYAKVLGAMSGIKENGGYDVRISSAAAAVLDIVDTDKFILNVVF